jgi:predicted nuclease of predicted toxin-antitoxin system
MLFMVDECLPRDFAAALSAAGHDVTWARLVCPGADDDVVLAKATAEGRILLTEDRDFGTLTIRRQLPAIGIVIAHVSKFEGTPADIAIQVAGAIAKSADTITGSLTVIEPGRTRQRTFTGPSRF